MRGWLKARSEKVLDDENILYYDWLAVLSTQIALEKHPWPLAVKADILRKRPRIGFTGDQVKLALGEPSEQVTRETAKGTVEVWMYPGRTLTFADGKVSLIETTK